MAFTEQGVAMLSSVLSSERATMVNIQIMRAFTQLRAMLATHADLKQTKNPLPPCVSGGGRGWGDS